MKEEWKEFPLCKDYLISNYGNVISFKYGKEKKLKGSISKKGYLQFTINKKNYCSHVLVAITFLNHKPNGTNYYVVDHIDNNKLNNKLDNLQLLSNYNNCMKSNGNVKKLFGATFYNNKYYAKVYHNGKSIYLGRFNTEEEASNKSKEYCLKNNLNKIF